MLMLGKSLDWDRPGESRSSPLHSSLASRSLHHSSNRPPAAHLFLLTKKVHDWLRNPIRSNIEGPLLDRIVMVMGNAKRAINAGM